MIHLIMSKKAKLAFLTLLVLSVGTLAASYLHGHNLAVLNPKGLIASRERSLIIIASLLMIIVVIPVFALTFGIVWKYRAGNTKAKYSPDWDHNRRLEATWWAIPSVLILILSILTWTSSHELDPYKPLASSAQPLTIQVVALDWKWLFIYPQQHIATVNFVQIPKDTPINFVITSDAPMNSFWIPQLGGQIYAMPGMSTQLHLMASSTGSYAGSSANISGRGFAGMRFIAKATSPADFNTWVASTQRGSAHLNLETYAALARPSENHPVATYASAQDGLYDTILMKYMMPNLDIAAGGTP
jgi:cytochrome o ubiquinol oxidase subunit 2